MQIFRSKEAHEARSRFHWCCYHYNCRSQYWRWCSHSNQLGKFLRKDINHALCWQKRWEKAMGCKIWMLVKPGMSIKSCFDPIKPIQYVIIILRHSPEKSNYSNSHFAKLAQISHSASDDLWPMPCTRHVKNPPRKSFQSFQPNSLSKTMMLLCRYH